MPLYFFDTRDNDKFMEDDSGLEFQDLDEVKVEAAKALAELARDVLPGSLRRELAIEVRDELGPVLKALMRFEAIILRST
jgi:anthranilate phosphoribosyltransferase